MHRDTYSQNSACTEGVLTAFQETKGGEHGCVPGGRSLISIRKNAYSVTLALVSSRRNTRLRAQTPIFTIENQHFLVQMAPEASWPPDVPAESLEARIPQPGVLSQASSARNPQPGVLSKIPQPPQPGILSQESSARIPQPGFLSQDSSVRSPQPGILSSRMLDI